MAFILRLLRLLGMVVWVGGLVFFAFVEAPTAFHVMGTNQQFALLIGDSISGLNRLGHMAGLVFLLATVVLWTRSTTLARKLLPVEIGLVVLMIGATIYVQQSIIPAMERDRAAVGGDITSVTESNPARADFDRLHPLSEKMEGSALLLGLGVIALMAFEESSARQTQRA